MLDNVSMCGILQLLNIITQFLSKTSKAFRKCDDILYVRRMEDKLKTIRKTRLVKKLTVTKYEDPGHGWYKLPRKILKALNLENEISTYSYQRNKDVYLEEDCDGTKALNELFTKGVEVRIVTQSTNKQSKIRSYERYSNESSIS